MIRLKTIFAVIFLLSLAQVSRAQGIINIKANSGSDRVIIASAIIDAYPNLPKDQQALIDQGLFFVMDYNEPPAGVLGYGPEDDPEYKYPDTKLWPEGTIKVNLTVNAFELMRVISASNDPSVQNVFKALVLDLIGHEIKHAQQYIAHPVLALSRADQCPEGMCDPERLKDTEAKMHYEFEATQFGYDIARKKISKEEWDRAMTWLRAHRSVLGPRLVDFPGAVFQETIALPLPDSAIWFYSAMYEPVMLVAGCAEGKTWNDEEKKLAFNFLIVNLHNKKDSEDKGVLEKVYPYLTPVFARLKVCLREQKEKEKNKGKFSNVAF